MTDVSEILSYFDEGDPRTAEALLPLVYDELRRHPIPEGIAYFSPVQAKAA